MILVWIGAGVLFLGFLIWIAMTFIYDMAFSCNPKYMEDEHNLPQGEQYEPYHEVIRCCVAKVLEDSYEEVWITSEDGLALRGRYYHRRDGAPCILFFHGYRCTATRDGNGIFLFSKVLGYNILMADQRGHGKSEGKTISFGILERKDALCWARWAAERFGEEARLILAGISMGAATVLMTADLELPSQVKGIVADCPYSSPKAIIQKVISDMHYPVALAYPLAKLAARILGGFDLEETSAVEAVSRAKVPILLIHGDDDRFVPCTMSREILAAGKGRAELLLIPKAGHGISHCVDAATYEKALRSFFLRTLGDED